jgi:hypothetical protein
MKLSMGWQSSSGDIGHLPSNETLSSNPEPLEKKKEKEIK